MNVKVNGDDKFMGCSCSGGEKGTEVIEEEREWFRMSRIHSDQSGTVKYVGMGDDFVKYWYTV